MFFTKLIAKKLCAMRRKKQTVLYWGAPKPDYAFGSPFMDGMIGGAMGTIAILACVLG